MLGAPLILWSAATGCRPIIVASPILARYANEFEAKGSVLP
jgi:hypothetical protein